MEYTPKPWRELLTKEELAALEAEKTISLSTIHTVRLKRNGRRVVKMYGKTLRIKHADGSISSFGLVVY